MEFKHNYRSTRGIALYAHAMAVDIKKREKKWISPEGSSTCSSK